MIAEIAERLFSPRKGERGPLARVLVERVRDSGGGWYRPPFRTQDPAIDPQEPYGSESSNAGYDHGWANCTMSAGAMVLAFHTLGGTDKWGGLLRHHQGDLSGGTDLYDLRDAWAAYSQTLEIRSGAGWDDVEADRAAGRALVLQGEGGTPGAGTYAGGHAIAVLPETHSDGRWLIGNPECNGFEWVSASALRDWAERWSSSIAWARSAAHPPGGGSGGGGDMGEYVQANGYGVGSAKLIKMKAGEAWVYMDGSPGGTFSADANVPCLGLVDAHADFYAVVISTAKPYSDGGARTTIVGVKTTADPWDAPAPEPPPDGGETDEEAYARGRLDEYNSWYAALGLPEPPDVP